MQSLSRHLGIYGQVRCSRVQHSEDGDDLLPALLHHDGDELVGAGPQITELASPADRHPLQLAVAQGPPGRHHGGALTRGPGLRPDQLLDEERRNGCSRALQRGALLLGRQEQRRHVGPAQLPRLVVIGEELEQSQVGVQHALRHPRR